MNAEYSDDTDEGYFVAFRIIDEADAPRTFSCALDLDGSGSLLPDAFDCSAGPDTRAVSMDASNFDSGIFDPEFTAVGAGRDYIRTAFFRRFGDVEETIINGALSSDDTFDPRFVEGSEPDFPPQFFYIDYFDLSDFVDEDTRIVQVESDEIDLVADLWVKDLYQQGLFDDASAGAQFSEDFGPIELIFNVDEEIRLREERDLEPFSEDDELVLSAMSFEELAVGSYTITIFNGENATPTVVTVDQLAARLSKIDRSAQ